MNLISEIHGKIVGHNPKIHELYYKNDQKQKWVIGKNDSKYYRVLEGPKDKEEYRVTFTILPNNCPVSLIGVQSNNTITPYKSPYCIKKYWLFNGILTSTFCIEKLEQYANYTLYWRALCVMSAAYCSTEVFWSFFVPINSYSAAFMSKPSLLTIPVVLATSFWFYLQNAMDEKIDEELKNRHNPSK